MPHVTFSPSEWDEIYAAARLCGAPSVETFLRDVIAAAVDEILDADAARPLPMLRVYRGTD